MPKYRPKQKIEDKFEIVEFLGEGAFSEVYKARNLLSKTKDFCVLKILSPVNESDDLISTFWTESEILQGLDRHSHIARLLAADQFTKSKELYLKLEYIEGPTIAAKLKENSGHLPLLPLSTTRQAALDLLEALIFLHEQPQPILHRDINPNNLILSPQRGLVIIDFNVSKILAAGTSPRTRVGTPPYVPPEIEHQDSATANWSLQSDIYSVGVVLYYMITGSNDPYLSKTDKPRGKVPLPISDNYPQIPAPVEAIVLKAIAYNPRDRYQSAHAMRSDILSKWPEGDSTMMVVSPQDLHAESKRGQADVDDLIRRAQALLGDEKQFDEGRIGALLDQVHDIDPENQIASKLRVQAVEKGAARRESRIYDETLSKCQDLWMQEQKYVAANVSSDQILTGIYKPAMDLVKRAMAEMPESLRLKGLASNVEIRYREAARTLEAKATADETNNYQELWKNLQSWLKDREKGPDYLIPWVEKKDEIEQQLAPKTVTDAILETEVIATGFARRKAGEYLESAKRYISEHNPRAARAALEKRNELFMLPVESEGALRQYDEKQVEPELKKLETSEEILQKAKLSDDPLVGWQVVEQAIDAYKWVSGVDETRRMLAKRILSRAEGFLVDGESLFEKYRTETSEIEIKRSWQSAREKFERARDLAERVRQYAADSKWEEMRSPSATLLKTCQGLLKECDGEGDLIRVLDDAASKLRKLLEEKNFKGALRQWKELKELYGESTLERFGRLRALRSQMESAQGIKVLLDRLENAFEDPARVKPALDECEALLQNPEYEKYDEQLRILREKLHGRLNYLTGIENLEKTGDAAEALKYLEWVTRLQAHPDKDDALKKVKEIHERKNEEARIEQAITSANDLLSKYPRRAYELLSDYEGPSLRKKEINTLLKNARELWEQQVVDQLEKELKLKEPAPKRLRDLAQELKDLPQPPPPPYAVIGRAFAEAAVREARVHAEHGRWTDAVKAWEQAIQQDGFNHPEYEQERRDARLRQVEMELGLARGEGEARGWLDSLKTEFSNIPQTWELEARFYYRLASRADAHAVERVRLYAAARQAIGLARDALASLRERPQVLVVSGRLQDLENRILSEETLARSMSQVEDMLKPERSQESIKEAARKVQDLRQHYEQSPLVEDWWRETRLRILAALEEIDDGLGEEKLWERFDARSKMLILDPNHTRAQELLRDLPNQAMDLDSEISKAITDRVGLTAQGADHLALEIQENNMVSLRERGQAAYDMLGQRSHGSDRVIANLRASLATGLGQLQTFLSELNTLRQWKTQAQHHLTQARVDDNWTNFDRIMSEVNRAGFGDHRSIRDLRSKRNEIEDKRKRLLVFRDGLLALAEDAEGRQADAALRKMEIFEKDPYEGDPADDFGLKSILQVRDPFSGRAVSGWFAVRRWLQDQKSQQGELVRWLTQCGLAHIAREMQLPSSTRNANTPKGIVQWPEIDRATHKMLDEGRFDEAARRVRSALEGEKLSKSADEDGGQENEEISLSIWADRQSRLLAWNAAASRLSDPPVKRDQLMSSIASQLLDAGEDCFQEVETWIASATKRRSEIDRQRRKWFTAESELNQAFRELQKEDAAWWAPIGKKQRIRESRERVQKALMDCRAIAPRHPVLKDTESHSLLTG